MIRKYKLIYNDKIEYREVKSDLSFGVLEGKKWLKEKYPKVKIIKHLKQDDTNCNNSNMLL